MLLANGRAKVDLMFACLFVLAAFTMLLHGTVSHFARKLAAWPKKPHKNRRGNRRFGIRLHGHQASV